MKKSWINLLVLAAFVAVTMMFLPGVPACDDRDRDNIGNSEDNCGWFYNPGQQDEDEDSLGDACDSETPLHGLEFARCYRATLTPPRGQGYENLVTVVAVDDEGRMQVTVDMPPELFNRQLVGDGAHNQRDIWFMIEDTTWLDYYALLVEGTTATADEENVITRLEGVYNLLTCPGCFGDPDVEYDYVNWSDFSQGVWTAEIAPLEYCGLEPIDDDTVDDDTVDDDDVDDDNDDTTPIEDDDADVTDDDDDDDNDEGCGCQV